MDVKGSWIGEVGEARSAGSNASRNEPTHGPLIPSRPHRSVPALICASSLSVSSFRLVGAHAEVDRSTAMRAATVRARIVDLWGLGKTTDCPSALPMNTQPREARRLRKTPFNLSKAFLAVKK